MASADAEPHEAGIAAAVAGAREAQRAWARFSARERAEALRPLKRRILSRAEEIGALLAEECGKPFEEAVLAEVLPNADLVDYWTLGAEELLAPEKVELDPISYPRKSAIVSREARGTLAVICPWNFPIAIPLRTLVPALVCGNAVVFKPSEHAPRAGALVASLFEGLVPDGLVTLLQGGADVGAGLVDSDIDGVVFTGSVRAGRHIAGVCATRLIPCSMELGGKDAAIVLSDAPIERTARGLVWGAFSNAGQNCASIERAYVVRSIATELVARIESVVAELQEPRDLGAMTTDAQAEIVREQVKSAVDSGARIIAGEVPSAGERRIRPIVLKLEDEACDLMREETFGPVLPIVVVEDEAEAVRRANASRFGLTVSVWTKRVERGEEIAAQLRAGIVTINNHAFSAAVPSLPWAGVGDSGAGVTNGPHALPSFVRPKLVLSDRSTQKRELWWYPYTPALRRVALSMASLRGGSGILGRVRAFFRLLTALPKRLLGDASVRTPTSSP